MVYAIIHKCSNLFLVLQVIFGHRITLYTIISIALVTFATVLYATNPISESSTTTGGSSSLPPSGQAKSKELQNVWKCWDTGNRVTKRRRNMTKQHWQPCDNVRLGFDKATLATLWQWKAGIWQSNAGNLVTMKDWDLTKRRNMLATVRQWDVRICWQPCNNET